MIGNKTFNNFDVNSMNQSCKKLGQYIPIKSKLMTFASLNQNISASIILSPAKRQVKSLLKTQNRQRSRTAHISKRYSGQKRQQNVEKKQLIQKRPITSITRSFSQRPISQQVQPLQNQAFRQSLILKKSSSLTPFNPHVSTQSFKISPRKSIPKPSLLNQLKKDLVNVKESYVPKGTIPFTCRKIKGTGMVQFYNIHVAKLLQNNTYHDHNIIQDQSNHNIIQDQNHQIIQDQNHQIIIKNKHNNKIDNKLTHNNIIKNQFNHNIKKNQFNHNIIKNQFNYNNIFNKQLNRNKQQEGFKKLISKINKNYKKSQLQPSQVKTVRKADINRNLQQVQNSLQKCLNSQRYNKSCIFQSAIQWSQQRLKVMKTKNQNKKQKSLINKCIKSQFDINGWDQIKQLTKNSIMQTHEIYDNHMAVQDYIQQQSNCQKQHICQI